MIIKIDDSLLGKYNFNFEKAIRSLIEIIPEQQLQGVGKVWITTSSANKKERRAYGLYYGRQEGAEIPTIIINANNLFDGIPKFIFYCLPIIPNLFLARTFYHEVGHHYQRLKHGITKERWEDDAKSYAKKLMLKRFGKSISILNSFFAPILFLYKKSIHNKR